MVTIYSRTTKRQKPSSHDWQVRHFISQNLYLTAIINHGFSLASVFVSSCFIGVICIWMRDNQRLTFLSFWSLVLKYFFWFSPFFLISNDFCWTLKCNKAVFWTAKNNLEMNLPSKTRDYRQKVVLPLCTSEHKVCLNSPSCWMGLQLSCSSLQSDIKMKVL